MLRYLFLLSLVFSLNAFSDVFLSSPKIKLNAQNQRVIEFRIENERINDGDITLNEYKTNNPIDESFIEYTLINDFGSYHTFTIVLDDEYLEDYFSFKILIKENFAKDIFIYLPSKVRSSFNNSEPYKPERVSSETTFSLSKNQNAVSKKLEQVEPDILIEDKEENIILNKTEQIEPEIQQNDIFKSSEITTVWSMAEKIKDQNENISIYQVMWSIYLGNRKAFLNDNINLIRADLDISIPSLNDIESISFQIAKESILDMNESYASRLQSATKSLLVLTAPNVVEDINDDKEVELKTENQNQLDFENKTDPEILIEQNTKQIRLEIENEILDELTELKQTITEVDNKFQTFDLIFISLISLASGVLLALIFIQIRNMRTSKEIQYDFEEASDDKSSLTTLPSDLSIKNDIDQQQFDLAVTYYEMSDKENAVALLKNLIQTTKNSEIREASEDLLGKVKQL
jgi:FimV-like protein